MIIEMLIVGVGGFFGSISRYLVYIWFNSRNLNTLPYATLIVNLLGCFLIGILSVHVERSPLFQRQLYLLAAVGFLGAFTTFSAFGLETLNLMRNHQTVLAVLNVSLNLVLGLVAVWLGRSLAFALYSS